MWVKTLLGVPFANRGFGASLCGASNAVTAGIWTICQNGLKPMLSAQQVVVANVTLVCVINNSVYMNN